MERSLQFGMTFHIFIIITILTALSLSSPTSFPVSAPTSISHSPRIVLRDSFNNTISTDAPGGENGAQSYPQHPLLQSVAIIAVLVLGIAGFTYFLVKSYLRSDDRRARKAAEEAEAGENKGRGGGGKENEGDGNADEGEGKAD